MFWNSKQLLYLDALIPLNNNMRCFEIKAIKDNGYDLSS